MTEKLKTPKKHKLPKKCKKKMAKEALNFFYRLLDNLSK